MEKNESVGFRNRASFRFLTASASIVRLKYIDPLRIWTVEPSRCFIFKDVVEWNEILLTYASSASSGDVVIVEEVYRVRARSTAASARNDIIASFSATTAPT